MRILAFLTLPLVVAGLKSNLVYLITLVPFSLVVWLPIYIDSVKLELLVLFSEVGLLGTGTGGGG